MEKSAIGNHVPEDWTDRFAATVAATVHGFTIQPLGKLALFAVDCHPWNGFLGLAILTTEEAESDNSLLDIEEMAAWRHYHFSNTLPTWSPAEVLGHEMQEAYEAAGDRRTAARDFLNACARAMHYTNVVEAIELLKHDGAFRISVVHPDDGEEFYHPPSVAGA
jgi:hypothetical protein